MDCIYLTAGTVGGRVTYFCHAQPLRARENVIFYKPTKDELENSCQNSKGFASCPRFKAFQNHQGRSVTKSK